MGVGASLTRALEEVRLCLVRVRVMVTVRVRD